MVNLFKARKASQVGWRVWDKVLALVGLGGFRPVYTRGDFWWCVGMSWASGFLVGFVLVMCLARF